MIIDRQDNVLSYVALFYLNPELVSVDLEGDKKFAKFVDFSSKKVYDEELSDIKFSELEWNNDKGVFYKKNLN